jgi:hypothetical protein
MPGLLLGGVFILSNKLGDDITTDADSEFEVSGAVVGREVGYRRHLVRNILFRGFHISKITAVDDIARFR